MEPLRTTRGEAAARRAATQFTNTDGDEQDHDNDSGKGSHGPLYVILRPFIWFCGCFYHVVLKRIYQCLKKGVRFLQRNARLFLDGDKYSFSAQFTMVNFLVLCSTWYVFIDQARLAFFKPTADLPLAIVDL